MYFLTVNGLTRACNPFLSNYDLADLETLLKALRQKIKLTIEFVGFTGERWPKSQKLIQRKRVPLE